MKAIKNLIYISAFAILGTVSFASCEDFLTAENKTAGGQTAEDYFSTPEGVATLRTYAYSQLINLTAKSDISNIYEDGTDLYTDCRGKTPTQFHNYSLSAENTDVRDFYVSAYSLVNYANAVLYYAGEDSEYAPEMHFLRAYAYYLLTQQFGAVPYSAEYINNSEREYPRKALSELYPNVITDLEQYANDSRLPATDHNGNVSQRAVKTLLAKLNLAAGWDLGTTISSENEVSGRYEENGNGASYFAAAAEWARQAINNEGLSLTFENKWSPSNEGNAEEIFSVQYDRAGYPGDATQGGHGLQNDFCSYFGDPTATGLKYCGSKRAPSIKSQYMWEAGDQRYDATFMTTVYNYASTWGTEGYYAYYNNAGALGTMPICYKYFPAGTSEAEVIQYINDNKARLATGNNVNVPVVRIMGNPIVTYTYTLSQAAPQGSYVDFGQDVNGNYAYMARAQEDYTTHINNRANGPTQAVKKWDDPATIQEGLNTTNDYRDVVIMHLSDLYLVAAEAYYMADDPGTALTYVNAVRQRAGLSPLGSLEGNQPTFSQPVLTSDFGSYTGLDVILDERGRELYAENYRWMDLRRTKQLVRYNLQFNNAVTSVAAMRNGAGETKWYRPLPAAEMSSNTGLTAKDQNPGY